MSSRLSPWPPDPPFLDESPQGCGGGLPNPSLLRGLLLSYVPAALTPALWAFATAPERLTWTTQLSSRIFSAVSPLYDELTELEGYGEALEQALLDLRGVPARVLDLATGTGYAARRLKRQYPNAEVIGVDASPEMVAIARHNAQAEDLDIHFEVGDAAKLGFEDAGFDLVLSQNAPPFCDEMLRLLRPRGKALLVYSFGGPWVELAWSPIAKRLERSGASHARGKRAGFGFYGIARKRA
jgi:SAM-dependent methyltransferase